MTQAELSGRALTEHAFTDHTVDSAPEGSRRQMAQTAARIGYLPAAIGRMAESPELLGGFLTASGLFEQTSLDPLTREVLILTVATRNECHLCVAMHTAKLTRLGADAGLIAALRASQPLADPRLEAMRTFTLAVVASCGAVSAADMQRFLDGGYTRQNALEVVLGVGAYTISTLANRMTAAPVDPALQEYAW
jgi:AhpD family alkylhydroperoxidase